jgi:hypothetical protein
MTEGQDAHPKWYADSRMPNIVLFYTRLPQSSPAAPAMTIRGSR